jgi:hypothetical protein
MPNLIAYYFSSISNTDVTLGLNLSPTIGTQIASEGTPEGPVFTPGGAEDGKKYDESNCGRVVQEDAHGSDVAYTW